MWGVVGLGRRLGGRGEGVVRVEVSWVVFVGRRVVWSVVMALASGGVVAGIRSRLF